MTVQARCTIGTTVTIWVLAAIYFVLAWIVGERSA